MVSALGTPARSTKSSITGINSANDVEQSAPIREMKRPSLGTMTATPTAKKTEISIIYAIVLAK